MVFIWVINENVKDQCSAPGNKSEDHQMLCIELPHPL